MSAAKRRTRRAVLYVRISKDRSNETSTTTQLAALRAYCAAHDVEIVGEYVERGRSAYKGVKRPQLDAAREAIRVGAADTLIAWQLDRLARSTRELLTIVDELRAADASLVLTQQQIDTDGVMGQLLLTVLGAVAELESGIKSERMLAAAEHRRKTGKPDTRGRVFGYETNAAGEFVPVPAEADGVRLAFEMFVDGESKAAIARALNDRGLRSVRGNELTVVAVRDILANPVHVAKRYDGTSCDRSEMRDRELIDGDWEPIVDADTFTIAQQMIDGATGTRATRTPGLLTSFAECGKCGGTMIARPHERGRRYSCNGKRCWLSCDESELDRLVLAMLVQLVDEDRWHDLRSKRNGTDPAAAIEAEIEQLATRYATGELLEVEWNAMRPKLIERLEAAMDASNDSIVPDVAYPFERWERLTLEQQRAVIAALVSSIVVKPGGSTRQPLAERIVIEPAV